MLVFLHGSPLRQRVTQRQTTTHTLPARPLCWFLRWRSTATPFWFCFFFWFKQRILLLSNLKRTFPAAVVCQRKINSAEPASPPAPANFSCESLDSFMDSPIVQLELNSHRCHFLSFSKSIEIQLCMPFLICHCWTLHSCKSASNIRYILKTALNLLIRFVNPISVSLITTTSILDHLAPPLTLSLCSRDQWTSSSPYHR